MEEVIMFVSAVLLALLTGIVLCLSNISETLKKINDKLKTTEGE